MNKKIGCIIILLVLIASTGMAAANPIEDAIAWLKENAVQLTWWLNNPTYHPDTNTVSFNVGYTGCWNAQIKDFAGNIVTQLPGCGSTSTMYMNAPKTPGTYRFELHGDAYFERYYQQNQEWITFTVIAQPPTPLPTSPPIVTTVPTPPVVTTPPPPGTTTPPFDCGPGYNKINGKCVKIIPDLPGFESVYAISGLFVVSWLVLRQKGGN